MSNLRVVGVGKVALDDTVDILYIISIKLKDLLLNLLK
jgi:hypothetical protein